VLLLAELQKQKSSPRENKISSQLSTSSTIPPPWDRTSCGMLMLGWRRLRTRRIRRRTMRDASTTWTTRMVASRGSTKQRRHRLRRCRGGSNRLRRRPVREGSTGSTADGGDVDAARNPPRGSWTWKTMPCSGHSRYGEDWTTRMTRTSSATRTWGRRGRTGGRRPRGTTTTTTRGSA
jgi:hypothetical protein